MTLLHDTHELSVTEAAQRGVAGLVADAEQGADLVVTRRSKPVAVMIGIDRLQELESAASDLYDLALVMARSAADSGRRTSLEDVLAAYDLAFEDLEDDPDGE
jgi:prevent-host-death family protein